MTTAEKRIRRRRRAILILLPLLLLAGGVGFTLHTMRARALLSRPLLNAIRDSKPEQVRALLDRGANPNTRDIPDKPIGLFDMVREWFDTSKRRKDANFSPALQLAVAANNTDMVKLLVTHGADVNARGPLGTTALHEVFRHAASYDIARLLLDNGANVNARNANDYTPLIHACIPKDTFYEVKEEDKKRLRLLLERGADTRVTNYQGLSALRCAMDNDQTAFYEPLIEHGADPNTQGEAGWTLLLWATRGGNVSFAEKLIARGADVNVKGHNGNYSYEDNTPLGLAFELAIPDYPGESFDVTNVNQKSQDLMRLLLKHGADPNTNDEQEVPLLWRAIEEDKTQALDLLLDAGANVNRVYNGQTALMFVVLYRNADCVRHLLDAGRRSKPPLNLDAQDENGQTALMMASYNGDADIVRLLLRYGANPNLRDHENLTARFYATDSPEVLALLRPAKANLPPSISLH